MNKLAMGEKMNPLRGTGRHSGYVWTSLEAPRAALPSEIKAGGRSKRAGNMREDSPATRFLKRGDVKLDETMHKSDCECAVCTQWRINRSQQPPTVVETRRGLTRRSNEKEGFDSGIENGSV